MNADDFGAMPAFPLGRDAEGDLPNLYHRGLNTRELFIVLLYAARRGAFPTGDRSASLAIAKDDADYAIEEMAKDTE